jgi:hypothetical protein
VRFELCQNTTESGNVVVAWLKAAIATGFVEGKFEEMNVLFT